MLLPWSKRGQQNDPFLRRLQRKSVIGKAVGLFVPGALSMGTGSWRRQNSIHSMRGPMEPTKIEPIVRLATPDAKLRLLADRWRARAKEILLQAAAMNDADARQKMLEVAASCERLAQRVEQRSGDADKA
jgi:hypothetical protein